MTNRNPEWQKENARQKAMQTMKKKRKLGLPPIHEVALKATSKAETKAMKNVKYE